MRANRQFRARLVELTGDCTADRFLTRPQTPTNAATIEELIEVVRDLSRRVAMCEVELSGRRIEIEEDEY